MYAVVEDAFGWNDLPVSTKADEAPLTCWHAEALVRMGAKVPLAPPAFGAAETRTTEGEEVEVIRRSPAEGCASASSSPGSSNQELASPSTSPSSTSSSLTTSPLSSRSSSPSPSSTSASAENEMVVSHCSPLHVTLSNPPGAESMPKVGADASSEQRALAERRSCLTVLTRPSLRREMLLRVARVSSASGLVTAMTVRPGVRTRSILCAKALCEADNDENTVESEETSATEMVELAELAEAEAAEAETVSRPLPLKVQADGLQSRMLLECFLEKGSREVALLQERYDSMLAELQAAAKFLGLDKDAQKSVSDTLAALSILKDFAHALAKCAQENAAREAEASRQAARDAKRPSIGKSNVSPHGSASCSSATVACAQGTSTSVADNEKVAARVKSPLGVSSSGNLTSPPRYSDPNDEYF
jgi:RNase H-fold protein (predicted Holliday junction resolvase)